jgi:hypothetical protein
MNYKELELLISLKYFFKVGHVRVAKNSCYFDVNSKTDLFLILQHFKKYPLQSSKKYNFFIFSIIFEMFCKKEHLTIEGFLKAITYINLLNKPISSKTLEPIIKNMAHYLSYYFTFF